MSVKEKTMNLVYVCVCVCISECMYVCMYMSACIWVCKYVYIMYACAYASEIYFLWYVWTLGRLN